MKLGFVLSNYKAKLQIEIRSLTKKIENKGLFKAIVNYKIKKQIRNKKELFNYVSHYIKYLENNNYTKLEKCVSLNNELKNVENVSELKEILENI